MENKIVKVSGDPIKAYITLWNGTWKLTDKEIEILTEFLRSYVKLRKDGLKEPYLSKYLFSLDNRKEIRTKIENISNQGIVNYLAALKRKNIIIEDANGLNMIDERVIPVKKLTFEFNDY